MQGRVLLDLSGPLGAPRLKLVPLQQIQRGRCSVSKRFASRKQQTLVPSSDVTCVIVFQKSRSALERYLFYCNRYMNHLKSLKMEHKLYDMAHQKMCELQQLGMSWIEVSHLYPTHNLGCLILLSCRPNSFKKRWIYSVYVGKLSCTHTHLHSTSARTITH